MSLAMKTIDSLDYRIISETHYPESQSGCLFSISGYIFLESLSLTFTMSNSSDMILPIVLLRVEKFEFVIDKTHKLNVIHRGNKIFVDLSVWSKRYIEEARDRLWLTSHSTKIDVAFAYGRVINYKWLYPTFERKIPHEIIHKIISYLPQNTEKVQDVTLHTRGARFQDNYARLSEILSQKSSFNFSLVRKVSSLLSCDTPPSGRCFKVKFICKDGIDKIKKITQHNKIIYTDNHCGEYIFSDKKCITYNRPQNVDYKCGYDSYDVDLLRLSDIVVEMHGSSKCVIELYYRTKYEVNFNNFNRQW
jgi:hypothetical protein